MVVVSCSLNRRCDYTDLKLRPVLRFCWKAGANLRFKRSDAEIDSNLDSNGRCLKAKNWMQDCNQCFCIENVVPACTLKGCFHAHKREAVAMEPQKETSKSFFDAIKNIFSSQSIFLIFCKKLLRNQKNHQQVNQAQNWLEMKNVYQDQLGQNFAIHVGAQTTVYQFVQKLDV